MMQCENMSWYDKAIAEIEKQYKNNETTYLEFTNAIRDLNSEWNQNDGTY